MKIEKKEEEHIVLEKVAAKKWSSGRVNDTYAPLTVKDEESYEEPCGCQPCGTAASVFARPEWGICILTILCGLRGTSAM